MFDLQSSWLFAISAITLIDFEESIKVIVVVKVTVVLRAQNCIHLKQNNLCSAQTEVYYSCTRHQSSLWGCISQLGEGVRRDCPSTINVQVSTWWHDGSDYVGCLNISIYNIYRFSLQQSESRACNTSSVPITVDWTDMESFAFLFNQFFTYLVM